MIQSFNLTRVLLYGRYLRKKPPRETFLCWNSVSGTMQDAAIMMEFVVRPCCSSTLNTNILWISNSWLFKLIYLILLFCPKKLIHSINVASRLALACAMMPPLFTAYLFYEREANASHKLSCSCLNKLYVIHVLRFWAGQLWSHFATSQSKRMSLKPFPVSTHGRCLETGKCVWS